MVSISVPEKKKKNDCGYWIFCNSIQMRFCVFSCVCWLTCLCSLALRILSHFTCRENIYTIIGNVKFADCTVNQLLHLPVLQTGNNQKSKTNLSSNTLTSQHPDKPLSHKQNLFYVHKVLRLQSAPDVTDTQISRVMEVWLYWICEWVQCVSPCILTWSGLRTGWAESEHGKAAEDSSLSKSQGTCINKNSLEMVCLTVFTCAPVSSALCIQESVSLRLWASSIITTC